MPPLFTDTIVVLVRRLLRSLCSRKTNFISKWREEVKNEILGFHLLIVGKSVYQKVGKKSNDLEWRTWDLRKYLGKKAKVQMVDQ